jgi:hypothetical protein
VHTAGQLTNTRCSDDTPELDGALREVVRKKILHYPQLYISRPDPISFLPVVVDTTGRLYDDFGRLLFLHTHREASVLTNEISEESDQFRFLRSTKETRSLVSCAQRLHVSTVGLSRDGFTLKGGIGSIRP